ncbi:MAG TPA: hypothetical protein VEG66_04255, partial [Thermoplasmata archaeon]|nr:hypothetical protein [Thermoplasmata archaeon]
WTGRRALELGLVDALADREGALEELAHLTGVPSRKTVQLSPPRPFLERLLVGSANSVGTGLVGRFQDSLEDAILDGDRYWLRR